MATSQATSKQTTADAQPGRELERTEREPAAERGTTTIADTVVAKVAGIAAREVAGVHDMGGATGRALGSVTQRVGLSDQRSQGVSVEVGSREAAVDLTLVVEYGESIARVAQQVRDNVVKRVEGLAGLTVTEVNLSVVDLHFPGQDDDEDDQSTRVQ